jgi:hypothetical protein
VVKGARVVSTEPRVLEGVGAVDFVCVGEVEPEMAEGLVWNELKLGNGILVGNRPSEVSDKGFIGSPGEGRRPHRGGGVIEAGWHC